MITTVNFHLIKGCNFKCKFCYATFNDIHSKRMTKQEQFEILRLLAESNRFRKINFAGGEPTLVPYITDLIIYAKSLGFETSIVTNASNIDFDWVKNIANYLDILTLSIDSNIDSTNIESGRSVKQKTVSTSELEGIAAACHLFGVNLKINTVVSKFNKNEILTPLINQLKPFRWKILQVTRVEGQNDNDFDKVMVSPDEFSFYCEKNRFSIFPDIKIIEENEKLIQGSYLMIDPLGRFYDSNNSRHNYSDRILKIGVAEALQQVTPNKDKFEQREGNYTTIKSDFKCTF